MNRREFTQSIIAGGVAAASPLPAMAKVAAPAARSRYIFAVALAHARTDVTVDMIVNQVGVRPHTARRLFASLIKRGVFETPNASGVARLSAPLLRAASQEMVAGPAGTAVVKGSIEDTLHSALQQSDDSHTPRLPRAEDSTSELDEAPARDVSLSDDDPAPPEASDAAHSTG